jgi:hypothetical protein
MSKNLKNIIREEIKDFDWIKNQEGMDPLLYELKNTNQNYKIWFGSIDTNTQNHIAEHLKSLGLNVVFNTKIKHNINSIGFDSLYFKYIKPKNQHGPDSYHYFEPQWSIDYMGCTNTKGHTSMQKCDENGASYGKGLESNRNYFDDKDWDGNKNTMELSSSLVESKTINESDDMDWIKDIPAGIEIGACFKYSSPPTNPYKLGVIEKITIISDDNDYYPKDISSIEELTTADYENTWVYLKNQETGHRNFLGVNEMVNNLEDGVLIPC